MGLVQSTTNSTLWGTSSPAVITALETIQAHRQELSKVLDTRNHCPTRYPFAPGSRECKYRWSALPQNTAPHRGSRDLSIQSRGSYMPPRHDALYYIIMEYMFRCRDTEGGHCLEAYRPQWFFYVSLNVSETGLPFTRSCEPREIRMSPMLKGKK